MSNTPRTDAQYDFFTALRAAKERVKACPLYRRFIHGTPLSNDIAVWIAVAYCEGADFARQLERELAEARNELELAYQTTGLKIYEARKARDEYKQQRDTLAEALYSIRHRLGDFREPWNSRETDIDAIAQQAIATVEGGEA